MWDGFFHSLFTTLTGRPARNARRFSTATSISRRRLSLGAQEICGVRMGCAGRGMEGREGNKTQGDTCERMFVYGRIQSNQCRNRLAGRLLLFLQGGVG